MKLFRVSRPENDIGYDEYDSMIVAADHPASAITFHPRGELFWRKMTKAEADSFGDDQREAWLPAEPDTWGWGDNSWSNPSLLTAELVGEALPETAAGTVLCASFNAG